MEGEVVRIQLKFSLEKEVSGSSNEFWSWTGSFQEFG